MQKNAKNANRMFNLISDVKTSSDRNKRETEGQMHADANTRPLKLTSRIFKTVKRVGENCSLLSIFFTGKTQRYFVSQFFKIMKLQTKLQQLNYENRK